jgi:hypothetical protein
MVIQTGVRPAAEWRHQILLPILQRTGGEGEQGAAVQAELAAQLDGWCLMVTLTRRR